MMRYGYGTGMGWSTVLFIALPVLLLVVGGLIAMWFWPARTAVPRVPADAERILAERLARGEIDPEEYERRLHTLRAAQS